MTNIAHNPEHGGAQPDVKHDPKSDARVIIGIDRMSPAVAGHIVVPLGVQAMRKARIRDMMPQAWGFASRVSFPIDSASGRMAVDTEDLLVEQRFIDAGDKFTSMAGIMRIYRQVGGRALDGYVVDYRRVDEPLFEDIGLGDDADSTTFIERQEQYGSVLPLGVLFADDDGPHYVGEALLSDDTLHMAREVDRFIIDLLTKKAQK